MGYLHMVFDVDGTLIDSAEADLLGLQDTVLELTGRLMPREELLFSQGIPGIDALTQLGLDRFPDSFDRWLQNILKHSEGIDLFPGMGDTVRALAKRGTKLGIVTSRTRQEFDIGVRHYDIIPLFGPAICVEDSSGHKPQPDPLLRYMELTGAKPEETLYIGDTINDSLCAQGAGVDFALALWGTQDPSIPARHKLERPAQLLEL